MSLVQTGTVGATPIMTDTSPVGFASVVEVTIGPTDYVATHPPGWPVRPFLNGTEIAEGSAFTVLAGATVAFHSCEAAALVAAGAASYAP